MTNPVYTDEETPVYGRLSTLLKITWLISYRGGIENSNLTALRGSAFTNSVLKICCDVM